MSIVKELSLRPSVLVDQRGQAVVDADGNRIGEPAPRVNRTVTALPLNEAQTGPVQIAPHELVAGLADPNGAFVGTAPALWVHRLVYALPARDTRLLP